MIHLSYLNSLIIISSYTPEELKYLPVNTAIYGPMATQKQSDIAPSVPPGSEVSSDDEDLSVSSEAQKPSKAEAATKTTTKSSSKPTVKSTSKGNSNKNNSKTTTKEVKRVRLKPSINQLAGLPCVPSLCVSLLHALKKGQNVLCCCQQFSFNTQLHDKTQQFLPEILCFKTYKTILCCLL